MRRTYVLGWIAAVSASAAIAAGPAEQRTRAALARIAAIDPGLGAVIAIDPSAARTKVPEHTEPMRLAFAAWRGNQRLTVRSAMTRKKCSYEMRWKWHHFFRA